ncbi:MAG TPA: ABC transporter permease [Rhodothermales bacterium]|nr:ABC transporter permease [Rhodothermales bacterium]
MLKNYLKIALRNLRKHKGYSLINITGLAIGLACFTLIMLYVLDEFSYDRHYPDADRIYRIALDIEAGEGTQRTAQSPPVWTTQMLEEFPEVEQAVRFKPPRQTWMVSYQNEHFSEKRWAFADSNVFNMFDLPLARGNAQTALVAPFTVVISESMAEKYFKGEDPLGKIMSLDNQYDFEVTGIMADMPENSHFHFDFLASFVSMEDPNQLYLLNALTAPFPFSYSYLLLEEGTDPATLEARFPAFIEAHVPPNALQGGVQPRAYLQPITSIHLHSHLENEIEANGEVGTVYIFLAIAGFLLLIACVNFMNLATARSAQRAKEVGMRKVVGAHRRNLIQQFLGESMMLALVALVIALVMVVFALSPFNTLTGKVISFGDIMQPGFLLLLLSVTLFAGLLAGSYPAFFLSAFRPAQVLKGDTRTGTGGIGTLRKTLIVFQFGISLILIISTTIVYNQMEYARNIKLGFDKERVVVIQLTDPTPSNLFPAYKQAILRDPNVLSASASISVPAGLINQATVRPEEAPMDASWQVQLYATDFDFVETMGMEMAAGRDLSKEYSLDSTRAFLINETAARSFGWDDPQEAVGKEMRFTGGNANNPPAQIVGVVKDFHSQSVHEPIAPTIMGFTQFWFFAVVRIQTDDIPATIASMRQTWEQMVPGYLFDYSFLNEDFDQLYKGEAVLGTLLGFFAVLTVFIACLGLFGLASFTAEQRTKEIGVRKSLGASVSSIVLLLSKEVTLLVGIAFVVAVPVAYFAMHRWLDGFAYHINIGMSTFILAGSLALLIAWLTVSYQSIKAALANPVNALRSE